MQRKWIVLIGVLIVVVLTVSVILLINSNIVRYKNLDDNVTIFMNESKYKDFYGDNTKISIHITIDDPSAPKRENYPDLSDQSFRSIEMDYYTELTNNYIRDNELDELGATGCVLCAEVYINVTDYEYSDVMDIIESLIDGGGIRKIEVIEKYIPTVQQILEPV